MKTLSFKQYPDVATLPVANATLAGVTVRLTTDSKPYYCDGVGWTDLTTDPALSSHIIAADPHTQYVLKTSIGTLSTQNADAVTITANTANAALKITQTGAGYCLLIEDSTSADSTPFVIDTDGRVLVGATTATQIPNAQNTLNTPVVQISANTLVGSLQSIAGWYTGTLNCPTLAFSRSVGASIGTYTAVFSGAALGSLVFSGANGTSFQNAARISGLCDGTVSDTSMPGKLVFSTTPAGSNVPLDAMKIDSAQRLSMGVINASARVHISSASDTEPTLKIQQTGAADCFVVEDSGSPDATPFVINSSGQVLIGHPTVRNIGVTPAFSIEGTGSSGSTMLFTRSSADTSAPTLRTLKTRGALGAWDTVVTGDNIFQMIFYGANGTAALTAASMTVQAVNTVSDVSMPGRILFSVSPNNSVSPSEQLRISGGYTLAATDLRCSRVISVATSVTSSNVTGDLSVAALRNAVVQGTPVTPITYTLPTGTLLDADYVELQNNQSFEWTIINLGTGLNTVTLAAATDHTIVGNAIVNPGSSGRFITRKTIANTFVTYRVAADTPVTGTASNLIPKNSDIAAYYGSRFKPAIKPTLRIDWNENKFERYIASLNSWEKFNNWADFVTDLGADLTITRSTTQTYFDALGVMRVAAVNTIECDHNPLTGVPVGPYIGGARTNLARYSQDHTQWILTATTLEADTWVAPDGATARIWTATTAVAQHRLTQSGSAQTIGTSTIAFGWYVYIPPGSDVITIWIRGRSLANSASSGQTAVIRVTGSGNNAVLSYISTAIFGSNAPPVINSSSVKIQNCGGGIFRISCISPLSSDAAAVVQQMDIGWACTGVESSAGTSNTRLGVTFWQMEVGESPSPYIPTTDLPVTRSATVVEIAGTAFTDFYNKLEGTLELVGITNNISSGRFLSLSDGTNNNRIGLSSDVTYGGVVLISDAGVSQAAHLLGLDATGSDFRISSSYKLNNISSAKNGIGVASDTSATIPTVNRLQIANLNGSGQPETNISLIEYYPRADTAANIVERSKL